MDISEAGAATGHDWWPMLYDPAFLATPYPQLQALREKGPIHLDERSGIYFVLGYEAFSTIAKSPKFGRDTRYWKNGWHDDPTYRQDDPVGYRLFDDFQHQMINRDGADHKRMRAPWEPAFRAPAMAELNGMIEAEAARLLSLLPDEGEADMIEAFAGPMPLRVLCNLFDISPASDADVARWSAALIRLGDILITQEQKQEALDAMDEFKAFLAALLAERRVQRDGSLMSVVIAEVEAGTHTEEEALVNLMSMMIAGHETTVTLIGNGLMLLLRHPEQMQMLRDNPDMARTAVAECLRVEPGGNMILRVALEDAEVNGVTIAAGSPVIGMVGAVNRDPARFPDPDRFDIKRAGNAHLTFGAGPHVCIGAPLARLEGQIAFNSLLARWPAMTLAGEPEWRLDRLNARGLRTLPVRLGQGA